MWQTDLWNDHGGRIQSSWYLGVSMSFRLGGAAALLLSTALVSTNAFAADLGGDCCADLEERVAELEATTARKGNRKVSLQIYGQVNTAVMFWDNGRESNAYVVDNDISSTRFGFKGKAKIDSDWSAGFKIEIETELATSSGVTENNDDPAANIGLRKAEWYLKSKTYGKLSVGQGDSATSGITEVDVSGTNVIAMFDDLKFGNDITVADQNGANATRLDSFTNDGNHEFNRINRVRYDTPEFAGFIVSAAWGEDDVWDVALRYAGEIGQFKVAAGIGYGQSTDDLDGGSNDNDCSDAAAPSRGCTIDNASGSASIIHTPTGLFVTGGYAYRDFDDVNDVGVGGSDYTDNHWFVRGGVSQKWISLGKTAFYAEYQDYERKGAGTGGAAGNIDRVEEAEIIGGGVVQKIDAAAMELYLGYRHVTVDDNRFTGGVPRDYDDYDVVTTGARIKF